ncbi:hypothetical protein N7508_007685 [Penicillium antarcticum]|uniref:uncharacterized protein n=1 Tax=Penicillium antarcticum TaxID=416450 RepID=UPI002384700F|nr:uncharacterized protein N7508_007685 [Penicillium antarcticum]KAJ5297436.1 hypothetical protein N7508_007685 [Penicillium antarcticum]
MQTERIQGAIDRYHNEIYRVCIVLESALKYRDWLVGDMCTYADLYFITWQRLVPTDIGRDISAKSPLVDAWMKRMEARPCQEGLCRPGSCHC